jgi:hypothetical protein
MTASVTLVTAKNIRMIRNIELTKIWEEEVVAK